MITERRKKKLIFLLFYLILKIIRFSIIKILTDPIKRRILSNFNKQNQKLFKKKKKIDPIMYKPEKV